MKGDPVNIGDKIKRCHLENKLRLLVTQWGRNLMEVESLGRQSNQLAHKRGEEYVVRS